MLFSPPPSSSLLACFQRNWIFPLCLALIYLISLKNSGYFSLSFLGTLLYHQYMAKIEEEARFDGKFVLTTNTELPAEEVAVTHKNLLQVEWAFRYLKDILETRTVYHHTAENTKGHIFCSYLALLLVIEQRRRLKEKGEIASWDEIIRDLRSLQAIKIKIDGKSFLLRSDFEGVAHKCFMAVGFKPPPQISQM